MVDKKKTLFHGDETIEENLRYLNLLPVFLLWPIWDSQFQTPNLHKYQKPLTNQNLRSLSVSYDP